MNLEHYALRLGGPAALMNYRASIYRDQRCNERNNKRVWFRTNVLRWCRIDVSMEMISQQGGDKETIMSVLDLFTHNDRGVNVMKQWCREQCKRLWHYEPCGTFLFQSDRDASLFKMWFING